MNETEVGDRLHELSLRQRTDLSAGADSWHTKGYPDLGIRRLRLADGPHGLRVVRPGAKPHDVHDSLPATCFPPAVGLGSTWNVELLERVGAALASEALAADVDVVLGPGINLKRSPLGGRNFEYVSEDPLLSGVLGAALVRGLQEHGVGACVKHFAANNQETDRMRVDVLVDERTLRELYLRSFEEVVRSARPWTVMAAYNFVNGVAASNHRWLLTDVLRTEWGFDGVVMSDWGAVYDRTAAVAAGLDLEMPNEDSVTDDALYEAVTSGRISEPEVDAAAARVVALGRRADAARRDRAVDGRLVWEDQYAVALAAARECPVLLKNDDEVLPLDADRDRRVAVIGRFAVEPRYQGAGSSRVNPERLTSALDELRRLAPSGVEITFAPGSGSDDDPAAGPLGEAVRHAAAADVTVLFLGLPDEYESEGFDRTDLDLPAEQRALLDAVSAVSSRLVVVLSNGSVVRLSEWEHQADAILEGWLLGEAGGQATAEILLGIVSPSGKLAESIPYRVEDTPTFLTFPGEAGEVRYGEGLYVGYRYYDTVDRAVHYPFGHGLGYTTFMVDGLEAEVAGSGDDLRVRVRARVSNVGAVAGMEVVQVYVAPVHPVRQRPAQELRGFRKVRLQPGEEEVVEIVLGMRAFARWDPAVHAWVVDSGRYGVRLGASSRDIRAESVVDVAGNDLVPPLWRYSTLAEWRAHPAGRDVLRGLAGFGEMLEATSSLDPRTLRMFEEMPLPKLVRVMGMALPDEELEEAIATANARDAGRSSA
jgi:beta-glucosidase